VKPAIVFVVVAPEDQIVCAPPPAPFERVSVPAVEASTPSAGVEEKAGPAEEEVLLPKIVPPPAFDSEKDSAGVVVAVATEVVNNGERAPAEKDETVAADVLQVEQEIAPAADTAMGAVPESAPPFVVVAQVVQVIVPVEVIVPPPIGPVVAMEVTVPVVVEQVEQLIAPAAEMAIGDVPDRPDEPTAPIGSCPVTSDARFTVWQVPAAALLRIRMNWLVHVVPVMLRSAETTEV
jgi:hypothetical protein